MGAWEGRERGEQVREMVRDRGEGEWEGEGIPGYL